MRVTLRLRIARLYTVIGVVGSLAYSHTLFNGQATTIAKWWKMGHRYGFWRMKHLLDAKSRIRLGEFLPWIGLALVIGLALDGQSTLNLPNYLWPIFAYTLTLIVVGVSEAKRASTLSMLYGVPLLIILLHISFSIGLPRVCSAQAVNDRCNRGLQIIAEILFSMVGTANEKTFNGSFRDADFHYRNLPTHSCDFSMFNSRLMGKIIYFGVAIIIGVSSSATPTVEAGGIVNVKLSVCRKITLLKIAEFGQGRFGHVRAGSGCAWN